jgi:hypothetical protein
MGEQMKHLSEEELIEYYYGEGRSYASVERHLRSCNDCAKALASLKNDLSELQLNAPPTRDAEYGDQVWHAIRNSLPVYERQAKKNWLSAGLLKGLSLATACVLLATVAFFAGRQWEHKQTSPASVANDQSAQQRVILVVLGDHLERSERLLIELRHADAGLHSPVQAEARELLAANRLYRDSAERSGDPALASALEHLERVLVELSNQPDGFDAADILRLQKEMNTDGLLFEVRVLRAKVPWQKLSDSSNSKGASI